MADWREFVQSVIFGIIFSFLLAKLFSVIFAFRDENLRIERAARVAVEETAESESSRPLTGSARVLEEEEEEEREPLVKDVLARKERSAAGQVDEEVAAAGEDSDETDDSDWEGVESTELDEEFSAATVFVTATAADRAAKVSNEMQLQLYGLYKIATEGPCTTPPPSALKMTARAKWQAWKKLGAMPPEEAMEKYIDLVTLLFPSWATGSGTMKKGEESKGALSNDSKGPMGPVFSTLNFDEDTGNQLQMDAIHAFAREGEEENILKCIESGVSVNLKDSEGRTPLHWAVDRGHVKIVELLVSNDSDVNAKDNEGQTPLHYAAVCDRESIAEYLVKQNANPEVKDNDGSTPGDLCECNWPFMRHESAS